MEDRNLFVRGFGWSFDELRVHRFVIGIRRSGIGVSGMGSVLWGGSGVVVCTGANSSCLGTVVSSIESFVSAFSREVVVSGACSTPGMTTSPRTAGVSLFERADVSWLE